jgi:glycosyltransferase involved in cell wall biosynthesis
MSTPLVSVLTPAYNAARYLGECIESVLNQRYHNWEYIIVNNCSTDATLDIAMRYAASDSRIRVVRNAKFVGVIENHNIAFRLISPHSVYCKVVSADDWLAPNCVETFVQLTEAHPSVDIAGSYQLSDRRVRWTGLPANREVFPGREVCRASLLERLDVFGNPTSSFYRSSLVRGQERFLPHSFPYADTTACYKHLQQCDFGFVHEILSTERIHSERVSATAERLAMGDVACMQHLLEYGPLYLTPTEFEKREREVAAQYYRFLGGSLLKMRERKFWAFHRSRMQDLGHPIAWGKVIRGAVDEIIEELHSPIAALGKLAHVLRQRALPSAHALLQARRIEQGKRAK